MNMILEFLKTKILLHPIADSTTGNHIVYGISFGVIHSVQSIVNIVSNHTMFGCVYSLIGFTSTIITFLFGYVLDLFSIYIPNISPFYSLMLCLAIKLIECGIS